VQQRGLILGWQIAKYPVLSTEYLSTEYVAQSWWSVESMARSRKCG